MSQSDGGQRRHVGRRRSQSATQPASQLSQPSQSVTPTEETPVLVVAERFCGCNSPSLILLFSSSSSLWSYPSKVSPHTHPRVFPPCLLLFPLLLLLLLLHVQSSGQKAELLDAGNYDYYYTPPEAVPSGITSRLLLAAVGMTSHQCVSPLVRGVRETVSGLAHWSIQREAAQGREAV